MAFFTPTTAKFSKNCITNWFLRRTPFFRPKLAKIAKNGVHNIDPGLAGKKEATAIKILAFAASAASSL
jgi:hypothetical protein